MATTAATLAVVARRAPLALVCASLGYPPETKPTTTSVRLRCWLRRRSMPTPSGLYAPGGIDACRRVAHPGYSSGHSPTTSPIRVGCLIASGGVHTSIRIGATARKGTHRLRHGAMRHVPILTRLLRHAGTDKGVCPSDVRNQGINHLTAY